MEKIPVNTPLLSGNEMQYLKQCIEDGWISSDGPFVTRFEKALSERVGRRHAIAVCNGSFALECALAALDLNPGDEVIIPTFTIVSCAAAVLRAGATPVLVDCDPQTWNLDVGQLADRVTARTRAIMPVHIYGLPVDMDPVFNLAKAHGLFIIEDAAQAHGQSYRDRPCGGMGDLSVFSFYANKIITTGEGGMILTDQDELAERCRALRNLYFGAEQRFVHERLGWNLRMSNLQAAVGLAQFEQLDNFVARKRRMGNLYTEALGQLDGLRLPQKATSFSDNIFWVYGVVLDDTVDMDASQAMAGLADLGVQTWAFFWPMHEQPVFKKMGLFKDEHYPVSEHIARRGFYLPSGLGLEEEQIEQVVRALARILHRDSGE